MAGGDLIERFACRAADRVRKGPSAAEVRTTPWSWAEAGHMDANNDAGAFHQGTGPTPCHP